MPRISGLVSGPLSLAAVLALLTGALAATGCASSTTTTLTNDEEDLSSPPAGRAAAASPRPAAAPGAFPSTYKPWPSGATLIRNATVLTGTGQRIDGGSVLIEGGRIAAVGRDLTAPAGAAVVDAAGKWVTPGIIDAHSHLGVYAAPGVAAHEDGNEATEPVTADMSAEHAVWPQDPQFPLALAGGVTSMLVLPGSANLIGGRGVTLKNIPARTVQEMKFPGAPYALKMACGENPKRLYGGRNRSPATRMGNIAVTRAAFAEAQAYRREWAEYRDKKGRGEEEDEPDRNLEMETLVGVMAGEILVHNHCYRADEMAVMIDVAKEFGYKIAAFHHGVEAYKIADLLAREGICGALWADWWGFKMEAWDGIRENIALVDRAGGCAIVHSDSASGIQRLNQEAAKAMAAGRRMGLAIGPEKAIGWITSNPARALGIAGQTGSLETGKMADVVVWSGDPFSVYARAEKVYIDGALIYDRNDPARQWRTDFEVGYQSQKEGGR
jgi:imidazolonepropionase-like amidohydrolase